MIARIELPENAAELAKEIGTRLSDFRIGRNLTQKEVAGRLNISHQKVSSWETGRTAIVLTDLWDLAEAFRVTVGEIMFRLGLWSAMSNDALRVELVKLMPDTDAGEVESVVRDLAALPPDARVDILTTIRNQVAWKRSLSIAEPPAPYRP